MIYCFVYEKNSKAVIFVSILHEKPIRIRRNWPRIESAYFNTANFEHSFSYHVICRIFIFEFKQILVFFKRRTRSRQVLNQNRSVPVISDALYHSHPLVAKFNNSASTITGIFQLYENK
jgi:hypothetical protein